MKCKGKDCDASATDGGYCKACMGKSNGGGVTVEDLVKSLDAVETLMNTATPSGRKDALMKKSLAGDISEEENAELVKLLQGSEGHVLGAEITKSMQPSDDLVKTIDASSAIGEIHSGTVEALQALGDRFEKAENVQGEIAHVLAKGLLDVGRMAAVTNRLVKSLAEQTGKALGQPVGNPRGLGTPQSQAVEKSFGDGTPEQNGPSRDEVIGWLNKMTESYMAKGGNGADPQPASWASAVAHLEMGGQPTVELMGEIAAFRKSTLAKAQ